MPLECQMDIYPRFQGSYEWDIAAGHLVIKEAGFDITDLTTGGEPAYTQRESKC